MTPSPSSRPPSQAEARSDRQIMDPSSAATVRAFDMIVDQLGTLTDTILADRQRQDARAEATEQRLDMITKAMVHYDNVRKSSEAQPISGWLHAGRECVIHKNYGSCLPQHVFAHVYFTDQFANGAGFNGLHAVGIDWHWFVKPDIAAYINGLRCHYTAQPPPRCLVEAVQAALGEELFAAVGALYDSTYRKAMLEAITDDMDGNAKAEAILLHGAPLLAHLQAAGLELPIPCASIRTKMEVYGPRHYGAGQVLDAIGALALNPCITDVKGNVFAIKSPPNATLATFMGIIDNWFKQLGACGLGFGPLPASVCLRRAYSPDLPDDMYPSEDEGSEAESGDGDA